MLRCFDQGEDRSTLKEEGSSELFFVEIVYIQLYQGIPSNVGWYLNPVLDLIYSLWWEEGNKQKGKIFQYK